MPPRLSLSTRSTWVSSSSMRTVTSWVEKGYFDEGGRESTTWREEGLQGPWYLMRASLHGAAIKQTEEDMLCFLVVKRWCFNKRFLEGDRGEVSSRNRVLKSCNVTSNESRIYFFEWINPNDKLWDGGPHLLRCHECLKYCARCCKGLLFHVYVCDWSDLTRRFSAYTFGPLLLHDRELISE